MRLPLRPNNPCSSDILPLSGILHFAPLTTLPTLWWNLAKVIVEKMAKLSRESTSLMHLLHLMNGAQHTFDIVL